ncbi:hypothetical protein GCM10010187_66440 [Actinomadura coerulea]|nr:hypothetical protein GCM10010187_66440 [Actinomadura coerulea]
MLVPGLEWSLIFKPSMKIGGCVKQADIRGTGPGLVKPLKGVYQFIKPAHGARLLHSLLRIHRIKLPHFGEDNLRLAYSWLARVF